MPLADSPRLRDRWIAWVLRFHRLVLILAVVVTALAGWIASRLHVDSDLRSLLPSGDPVLVSLDRIESSFGALGSVNIVVKGGSVAQRHAFADALAERASHSELVRDVEYRLRSDFFADHALYYLADAEMEQLEERVAAYTHYELCKAEPEVCLEPPDPAAPEALRSFVRSKQDAALGRTSFRDYFERDGIDALVLLVHPTQASSDLNFSQRVTAEMRGLVADVHASASAPWAGSAMTWNIVGPYQVKADERAMISRDMLTSGSFGFLGVVLILYLLLRSGRAVLTLMAPLVCGVVWSMAFTQLVLGHLNTLTSLISTVVMGMGIDAGIHFLLRVREEQAGVSDSEAIARAFGGLIAPLLVAAGTTLGAFAVMASSAFPAFMEFGLIAGSGVGLCLLAMVTVYPAALRLSGVKRVVRRADRRAATSEGLLSFAVLRRPGLVLALVVLVSGLAGYGARKVQFENNGRELQSNHTRAQVEADIFLISDIFGKDIHAGILVVDTLEQARSVLAKGRADRARRLAADEPSTVADLFAAPDLLPDPTIDVVKRSEAIAALTEDIPEDLWARLDRYAEDTSGKHDSLSPEDARRLKRMLKAQAVHVDQLPPAVRERVVSKDGRYAVYAYPNFDAADISKGAQFMAETARYSDELPPQSDACEPVFVGETTVYALMYRMMLSEAPYVLGASATLIALMVLVQLRSLTQTLRTLLPLALGMLWLVGLMGLLDVRFTLFNIPILPAILGIGVDNGVYLTDRIKRLHGEPGGLASALGGTGTAILAATATTMMGFAAFMVADNGGLRGIGELAVMGISIAAITAILVLPALAAIGSRRR
ncbi:MMPL family transporter [Nannocystis sp.]|uniref:efflux RND transporter permease subunit n=1 Tax=Nannocystis sp. TaxID=1962667 RepID=UPI002425F6A9|nr:MMPL family transporter [Nannocystis sp.]MBK7824520.1 MMPL family transporter [Nannocystis sp.]MBK9753229.1 MMPL family transporter [Nannocystis sp.]